MAPGIPQDIGQGLTTGIDIGYYSAETPREPGHPNVVAQHYRDLAYLQQRRILTAADRTEPTKTITVISKEKRRSARQMPPGELLPLEKAALYDGKMLCIAFCLLSSTTAMSSTSASI
jgi:hypothetical protein